MEHYLKFSLRLDFLMSLHGVNFVHNYIYILEYGASNYGLWFDFTTFFWLSEFIKRPIEAWSTKTSRAHMNVGDKFNTNEKLILAYHEGMNGHFELVKRLEIHNSSLNNNISNMQKKDNATINNIQLLQHKVPRCEKKICNEQICKTIDSDKKCKITNTYIT
jgi:hypothetical protein